MKDTKFWFTQELNFFFLLYVFYNCYYYFLIFEFYLFFYTAGSY